MPRHDVSMSASDPAATSLDALAADVLRRYGYRFGVAESAAERAVAYRIRYQAVVERQWLPAETFDADRECDRYDDAAVHLVGWDGAEPVATGRLVLPPGPLPTEDAWGIAVEPRGQVVDVGRMAVVRSHQSHRHAVFVALLARLYLEMRSRGYEVACGVMSPSARSLVRMLGLRLEVVGEEREYWGERRAPVRFTLTGSADSLRAAWRA
jgi:N-acyl-L-homoserine lactone synthetase